MGTFKKYIAAIALEMMQLNVTDTTGSASAAKKYDTIPYKDTNETLYSAIAGRYGNQNTMDSYYHCPVNFSPFANIVPHPTGDDLSDYSINDCTYVTVSSCSWNYSIKIYSSMNKADRIFVIRLMNEGNTQKTVRCIKFTKEIGVGTDSTSTNGETKEVLVCGYFFDNPIVLDPGESTVIILRMEIRADQ